MKSLLRILCISIAFLGAIAAGSANELLTFDDIPTGGGNPPIPNGYGGLNWYNFGVLDGLSVPPSYGYYTGLVSAPNVAFNFYGSPASISVSSGLFDLDSAYLTSALNSQPTQYIQVQGYSGTTMRYNNTYLVNNTGPTFINFDYLGINSVTFTSGAQEFAMDNLTVTVPEPNACAFMLMAMVLGGFCAKLKCGRHFGWRRSAPASHF
jgi:hypothetical protein